MHQVQLVQSSHRNLLQGRRIHKSFSRFGALSLQPALPARSTSLKPANEMPLHHPEMSATSAQPNLAFESRKPDPKPLQAAADAAPKVREVKASARAEDPLAALEDCEEAICLRNQWVFALAKLERSFRLQDRYVMVDVRHIG
jgi:hypothetical protein